MILAHGCDGAPPTTDAAMPDGGPVDGGPVDGGQVDGGPVDGGPVDGGGAGPTGSLAELADAWCPTVADRFCASATSCSCGAVPGFGDAERCLLRTERGCRAQLARFVDPVASGLLVPAPRVPEGCLTALEAALADCRAPEPDVFTVACPLVWPREASHVLPGAGGECFEGLCAAGARCDGGGICAVPTSGGECERDQDCPPDERCGEDGTCRALRLDGAGGACGGPTECAGDLRCLASAERSCQARAAGGACTGDDECLDGAFCDEGACVPAPGLGELCGGGVACASGLGCRFAPGEGEGTCQPLPVLDAPCALGREGPFLCAEGLACRDRRCGAVPGEGERCASGEVRCADGLACHVEDGESVCRPPVGEDAECMLDESCAEGLYCDFRRNQCTRWLETGQICRDGNECGDQGACVPDDAGTFRCVPRPALGEACFLDGSCVDELVCRSVHVAGACAPALCAAYGL